LMIDAATFTWSDVMPGAEPVGQLALVAAEVVAAPADGTTFPPNPGIPTSKAAAITKTATHTDAVRRVRLPIERDWVTMFSFIGTIRLSRES